MNDSTIPAHPWHTTGATPRRWKAVWPITADGQRMTMRELIVEARTDPRDSLAAVAARHRFALVSRPRFARGLGQDHPGSGGADEVLVAYVLVVPVQRPADEADPPTALADAPGPQRVDAEAVEWLVDAGENWHGVTARFKVTRDAVIRALHRDGRPDLQDRLDTATHGPDSPSSARTRRAAA